jgi:hypothetical protein
MVIETGRRESPRKDDPESMAVMRYGRLLAQCRTDQEREQLGRQWPVLDAARRLATGDKLLRWEVEARILAGQSDEEIASLCGQAPETIRWYEAVFFQVRDRLVRSRDWIMFRAVGGGPWNSFSGEQPAVVWRYAGYTGGVPLLEVFISASTERPMPEWVRAEFADNRAYGEARFRLLCKLVIGAMTAQSPQEMQTLVTMHDQIDRMHRKLTGKRKGLDRVLHLMKTFLKSVRRCGPAPGGKDSSAISRRHEPTGNALGTGAQRAELAVPSQERGI